MTSRHHTRARPRQVDQHDQDAAAGAGERAERDPPAVEVDHPPGHEPSTSPAQQGVQIRQPKSVTANLRAAPPSGAAGARGRVPGDADGVLVGVVGFAVTQLLRRHPGTACAWVAAATSPAGARPACRR